MKNKMLYIPIFFILVVFYASFYFYKNSTPKQNSINFKCPEYYATDSEYSSSIDKYIHQEVSSNPNATAEDIMRKRYKLLVDNHCEELFRTLKINCHLDLGQLLRI